MHLASTRLSLTWLVLSVICGVPSTWSSTLSRVEQAGWRAMPRSGREVRTVCFTLQLGHSEAVKVAKIPQPRPRGSDRAAKNRPSRGSI